MRGKHRQGEAKGQHQPKQDREDARHMRGAPYFTRNHAGDIFSYAVLLVAVVGRRSIYDL
jgi:hypothetical protein